MKPISASSRTKMRKAWCSTTAIFSRSTSIRAGTASKAAAELMPVCSIPRRSTAPARSTSCSANPTRCSARTRSRSATSPIPVSTAASIRPSRITSGASITSPMKSTRLPRGAVSIRPLSRRSGSSSKVPNEIYSFTARGRFDQATFTPERLELESRANFDRWSLQLLYGDYAAQPLLGFLTRREGFLAGASVKVTENWLVLGSARYDIVNNQFDQTRIGLGYVDDCFMLSLNWLTGYTYNGTTTPVKDNSFMFQLSL